MDNRERRDQQLAYIADEAVFKEILQARKLVQEYNRTDCCDFESLAVQMNALLGSAGQDCVITQPFYCDYGKHIHMGNRVFLNYGCTVIDVAEVHFGDNVLLAPNVSVYTAGHPIHPVARNSGYEYGLPVTIGSNVWIGGNAVICPGVTIGDNTVIGAGSVVVKDNRF